MKLTETDFFRNANVSIADNEYHNAIHVSRTHDAVLDLGYAAGLALTTAVQYHDSVYDAYPNKEYRSANKMIRMYEHYRAFDNLPIEESDIAAAFIMIMSTSNHRFRDWPEYCRPIIKADLYDLTLPEKVIMNYHNIMKESMRLYDITEKEFAETNIKFMSGLAETVGENLFIDGDNTYWKGVLEGIKATMNMSVRVLT